VKGLQHAIPLLAWRYCGKLQKTQLLYSALALLNTKQWCWLLKCMFTTDWWQYERSIHTKKNVNC